MRYGDKFVSIKEDDPYTIALPRALELIEEKKILDAKRLIQDFPDAGIRVLDGPYGPYVTDGKKNARVPKNKEVPKDKEAEATRAKAEKLTLDECKAMIDAAPERRGRRGSKKAGGKKKPTTTKRSSASKKKPRKKGTRKKPQGKKTSKKNQNDKELTSILTDQPSASGDAPVEAPAKDS